MLSMRIVTAGQFSVDCSSGSAVIKEVPLGFPTAGHLPFVQYIGGRDNAVGASAILSDGKLNVFIRDSGKSKSVSIGYMIVKIA